MVLHIFNRTCAQVLKVVLSIVPLDLKEEEILKEHLFGTKVGEQLRRSSGILEKSETVKDTRDAQEAIGKSAAYRGARHQKSARRGSYYEHQRQTAQEHFAPAAKVSKKRKSGSRISCQKDAARAVKHRKPLIVAQ
eukprot:GEMP01073927.1.p1 GENE.GEMP01073927.1~~GEMP01073927.1.p1  ORF type:complete len:136 (+),score=24.08 GEMP01073927.1:100-507(+)